MHDVVSKHVESLISLINVDALRLFFSHKGILMKRVGLFDTCTNLDLSCGGAWASARFELRHLHLVVRITSLAK